MNYVNPWADAQSFVDLGSYTLGSGKVVDLYALKELNDNSREWYSIGVRYSNEPSDYGSGTIVIHANGKFLTHKTTCKGASVAICRLVKNYIKEPVFYDRFRTEVLFDASGAIQWDFNEHLKRITEYSIKMGYISV